MLREEPVCAEEGCEARSTSVDHIVSLAEGGGPYDRSNVRGMCYEHHKRRSSRQGSNGAARRACVFCCPCVGRAGLAEGLGGV